MKIMEKMKRKRKLILIVLAVILIVVVIGIKKKKTSGKKMREVVTEIKLTRGKIQTFVSVAGVVKPQNRLEIKPSIGGRIEEILVREGDKVERGEIVAWMSSTERAALLDAARAQGEKEVKYWENVYKPTPLIAPLAGEVIVRAVEPGQTVTTATAVIVLSDHLIVKAQIDETDIGKIKSGQVAKVTLDAYPDIQVGAIVGHISYESELVNNVTIYEVDIILEEIPEVCRSGMSTNVDIVEESKSDALLLPLAAVKREGKESYVLLLQKGKEIKQVVEIGLTDEKNVEILSGVTESDTVLMKTQEFSLASTDEKDKKNPFWGGRRRRKR